MLDAQDPFICPQACHALFIVFSLHAVDEGFISLLLSACIFCLDFLFILAESRYSINVCSLFLLIERWITKFITSASLAVLDISLFIDSKWILNLILDLREKNRKATFQNGFPISRFSW